MLISIYLLSGFGISRQPDDDSNNSALPKDEEHNQRLSL